MIVRSGQAITAMFATTDGTNATVGPTGTLYVNGTANGATVTVTNVSTGLYKSTFTLPTLEPDDNCQIVVSGTVSGVAGKGVVWTGQVPAADAGFTIWRGHTAGGSTTTRIVLDEAYDDARVAAFVGNYLIIDDIAEVNGLAVARKVVAYGNPGSGASYVDVDPTTPYGTAPDPALAARIVTAATGDWPSASDISNALAGASNITVLGTVNGQVIEVVRKDTYVGYGRDFTFTKVAGEPWPDDLSGWTITWTANRSTANVATGTQTGVASVTLAGTVSTPTGTQEGRFGLDCGNVRHPL